MNKHSISKGLLKVALGNFSYNEIERANQAIRAERLSDADIAKIIYGKAVDTAGKLGIIKDNGKKVTQDMIDDEAGSHLIGYIQFEKDINWGADLLFYDVKKLLEETVEPVMKKVKDRIESIEKVDTESEAKRIEEEADEILKDLNKKAKYSIKHVNFKMDDYSTLKSYKDNFEYNDLFTFKTGFIFSKYTFESSVTLIETLRKQVQSLKSSWSMKYAEKSVKYAKEKIEKVKKNSKLYERSYDKKELTRPIYRPDDIENSRIEGPAGFGESYRAQLMVAKLNLKVAQFELNLMTLSNRQTISTLRNCSMIAFANLMKIKHDTRKINEWYDKKLKGQLDK